MAVSGETPLEDLMGRIEEALNGKPYRPWCIHRLCEEVVAPEIPRDRDGLLILTEQIADELASEGRAQRERVSAISIGVHCQDSMYWSAKANEHRLDDFGPEYETPTILHRLASHMYCHGL